MFRNCYICKYFATMRKNILFLIFYQLIYRGFAAEAGLRSIPRISPGWKYESSYAPQRNLSTQLRNLNIFVRVPWAEKGGQRCPSRTVSVHRTLLENRFRLNRKVERYIVSRSKSSYFWTFWILTVGKLSMSWKILLHITKAGSFDVEHLKSH